MADRTIAGDADPMTALRAEVDAIGSGVTETVSLPRSGRELRITRPTNMDDLLDRIVDDPEQNLPYWAELWPSGIALADAILDEPALVAGQRTLELGCGAGTTAAAALLAGADLTVTDYAPEALILCRYNALANGAPEPEQALRMNWRAPHVDFLAEVGRGYAVALAADALYERRDIAPLLALADRVVAPGGLLWLAEPGRDVAAAFLDDARRAGWLVESTHHDGPWPDPADAGTRVGLHRLTRI